MDETQMYWLAHRIKKPHSMTPRDFQRRFTEIVDCSIHLEGNFTAPTEHDKKTWFFRAFPRSYRKAFAKASLRVEDKTMDQIMSYFQTLHDQEEEDGKYERGNKRKRGATTMEDNVVSQISNNVDVTVATSMGGPTMVDTTIPKEVVVAELGRGLITNVLSIPIYTIRGGTDSNNFRPRNNNNSHFKGGN
jgi:hypothetical protein